MRNKQKNHFFSHRCETIFASISPVSLPNRKRAAHPIWEPTTRVYVRERFNISEGATLARDMLLAARELALRTKNPGLELEYARHTLAKFTLANVRMNQAGVFVLFFPFFPCSYPSAVWCGSLVL